MTYKSIVDRDIEFYRAEYERARTSKQRCAVAEESRYVKIMDECTRIVQALCRLRDILDTTHQE